MQTLFFWISKLAWIIVRPDTLMVILVLGVWILLYCKAYKMAILALGFLLICMIIILLVPFGRLLITPLEMRFPPNPELPETVDGIIVLSGGEEALKSVAWNQVELNDAADRDLMFLKLAREFPKAKLVFTGGSGSLFDQRHKAADMAMRLFKEQGLDTSRVLFERESRNTYENALFSKALVNPAPDEDWVLITTAWHMPRAVGIFCKTGWPVIPYPVDHATIPNAQLTIKIDFVDHLKELLVGAKEWTGLAAYYLTGKTTALFPGLCR